LGHNHGNFFGYSCRTVGSKTGFQPKRPRLPHNLGWIKERLSRSIKHEYDLNLERFKADLSATNAVEIERLKARLGTEYKIITDSLL